MSNFITVSAERLRLSLSIALGLIAVITIGLSILSLGALRSFASDVNKVVIEAETIDSRIEVTKQKIALFDENAEAAELASQVVAESESYQYQNEAYNDLAQMAKRAGLTITRYSFSSTLGEQATQSPDTGSAQKQKSKPANGAKPTYITIELDNPVNYRKFLNLLHYIEQNLTKMQIASVSLSSAGDNSENVSTSAVTVEVFIR